MNNLREYKTCVVFYEISSNPENKAGILIPTIENCTNHVSLIKKIRKLLKKIFLLESQTEIKFLYVLGKYTNEQLS